MSDLLEQVENMIISRRLLRRGQAVLVAVSGGLDSMTLLAVLHELTPKHHWKLAVAHFNHRLRGLSSNADERLVRSRAVELRLACVVERTEVKTYAREHKVSIEMAARQLRHEFLARAARKLRIKTIALAHHADDQVELFFVRLLRGAGSEGLAGMPRKSASPSDPGLLLVRPLLDQPKVALVEFARRKRIRFREDATNASFDMLRNRVRHELIPLLMKHYQPGLAKVIQRQVEILSAEAEFLKGEASAWLQRKGAAFEGLPVAIQRHCLRLQLFELGERADFELVEQLRRSAGTPVTVAPQTRVARDQNGQLHKDTSGKSLVLPGANELTINLAGQTDITFDGVKLCWKLINTKQADFPRFHEGCEWFDADKVGPIIRLRHWCEGDRFQPIGIGQPVKLQDVFTNAKIPRATRHRLTVATTQNGEIWWVEGLRISEKFKLIPQTQRRLQWEWKRLAGVD